MKRLKSTWIWAACSLWLFIAACHKEKNNDTDFYRVGDFPEAITLTGTDVELDTVAGIAGEICVSDGEYLFYLYSSDHFIMATDSAFNIKGYMAKHGDGTNNVLCVSGPFGQRSNDGDIMIYDSSALRLYQGNHVKSDQVHLLADLSETMGEYAPIGIIQTADGKFIGLRGNFKYGLVSYTPGDEHAVEWPVGNWGADQKNIIYAIASHRTFDYNPANRIIGEIYGCVPLVILHDENGEIRKMLLFDNMPSFSTLTNTLPDYFRDIKLTDNHIYLLQWDGSADSCCRLLILDYEGNPQADLHLEKPAYTFDIDTAARKIIAVNPNYEIEGENVRVYELPASIPHP